MPEPEPYLGARARQESEANTAAFTALYEQYAARVLTYCQYRCTDSATAQDLAAQVFEKLMRSLPRYDADRVPASAWIFAIARHVVADWQRWQYLRKFVPWETFTQRPSGAPGPEQAVMESEERRQLRRALEGLSDRERDLVGLRFASGMTNRAIAELTGLSESNVAVILYRALKKLRQTLSEPEGRTYPNPNTRAEVDHE